MDSIGEAVSQNGLRMTKISGCISTKFAMNFFRLEMTPPPCGESGEYGFDEGQCGCALYWSGVDVGGVVGLGWVGGGLGGNQLN